MSMEVAQILAFVVGQVLVAGAIYGGIRSDIKNLCERAASNEKRSDALSARIDQLIMDMGR
jgi:outer membrane murein-binding lipoprotein Lpp